MLGAYFIQYVLEYPPCPLCYEQRNAYYVGIPLAALLWLGVNYGASRKVLMLGFAVIALAWAGQILWPAPQIEEGHNVFITDGSGGALQRNLPADAFRQMSAEFDARYPPDRRCDPAATGCWRSGRFPDRPYAFSADAIYNGAAYSRRVNGIDFFDPVWLRLAFAIFISAHRRSEKENIA